MLVLLGKKVKFSKPNSKSRKLQELFLLWPKPTKKKIIQKILEITRCERVLELNELNSYKCFIGPRIGTISPWSSKATEICKNSNYKECKKLERVLGSEQKPEDIKNQYFFDRMVNDCFKSFEELEKFIGPKQDGRAKPRKLEFISPKEIFKFNDLKGLALSETEIESIVKYLEQNNRNITDAEIMMFAQINSEHCRHKIFNANWIIDGDTEATSLFKMIQNTMHKNPNTVLSAYKDNAAVIKNNKSLQLKLDPNDNLYYFKAEDHNIVLKVETHNHPTAISPFPGAATGSGGEIRDESATGLGAQSKAGITGFSVSNLRIPTLPRHWEISRPTNPSFSSALKIMLEAPIGSASYNNEFGRPSLNGFFRSFEESVSNEGKFYSYDKPIMVAGGVGSVLMKNSLKCRVKPNMPIIVLGGPSMLIGLGGGAASSITSGSQKDILDYSSVQRGNAEMQRRTQEVLNALTNLDKNIIESIHDVGAGGLSNAVPEIVNDSKLGGYIDLTKIPSADPSLSPMEIWCNESQERYVLIIQEKNLGLFSNICSRERAPYAVIGTTTKDRNLTVIDPSCSQTIIDLPLDTLFKKESIKINSTKYEKKALPKAADSDWEIEQKLLSVLGHPTVADKRFLITIGDRTVGGLTATDQMVGPWQVPISNCAVISDSFLSIHGVATAIGEKGPVSCLNGPAAARLTIAEAITNLLAADINRLEDISISANWMCASEEKFELSKLYEMVKTVGLDLCPSLGINIPVGKDSMSMKTIWGKSDGSDTYETVAPTTLIATGASKVGDTNKTLSPCLKKQPGTLLLLIDLGLSKNRLGGSILDQIYKTSLCETPDIDQVDCLLELFKVMKTLRKESLILAYHDRSDGGLFTTIAEMAFGGRVGVSLKIPDFFPITNFLLNEEAGVVLQIEKNKLETISKILKAQEILKNHFYVIGEVRDDLSLEIKNKEKSFAFKLQELLKVYSETTISIQKIRDNPSSAEQELNHIIDINDPGLFFDEVSPVTIPQINPGKKPKIGVIREQGVNGQNEMAAAFSMAGFECIDIHMQDFTKKTKLLGQLNGIALVGGFSYGDVLGAGTGWANTILFNENLRETFANFFAQSNKFTFGVCNGCQALSQLKTLIPGAEGWPEFRKNESKQFESRLLMVEIIESPSIFFRGLTGVRLPIVVAHGEGRVKEISKNSYPCMRFVDNYGKPTMKYPTNPNGSIFGLTAFTTCDGRATIMMPHPERVFLNKQFSWNPSNNHEFSPWMHIFRNAREWVG
ncbi:MAG: phosphoribosylformylglycinamidine synthase [Pseudomonadota bacterium]|nr:phosphoribosylformylglycinamidine synthase [Pseudomonadota bacterium]